MASSTATDVMGVLSGLTSGGEAGEAVSKTLTAVAPKLAASAGGQAVLGALGPVGMALGGVAMISSAIEARKAKKREERRLNKEIAKQETAKRENAAVFNILEQREIGKLEEAKSTALDDYLSQTVGTIKTLEQQKAQTGFEGAGTFERRIGAQTRKTLTDSIDKTLNKFAMQFEDTQLSIGQQEQSSLDQINSQIDQLNQAKDNL
tara:strand:+ start:1639 stop:2256 length:618 start_codon:yes stop_codon:yes gene_type:complete